MDKKAKFNPVVEIKLFSSLSSQPIQTYSTESVDNVREIKWGNTQDSTQDEFTRNMGKVHHSGELEDQPILI